MHEPDSQISDTRKMLYYGGMICAGIGLLLFLSTFVSAALNFGRFDNFESNAQSMMIRAVLGMFMMMGGGAINRIGAMGFSASGLFLDPDNARKDVKPWTRMAGGITNDAMNEIDIVQDVKEHFFKPQAPPAEQVKVRCRQCKSLNDEDAKFCDQCGAEL
jgi:hypothetical protein